MNTARKAGITLHFYWPRASFRIASNRSGASLNEPFLIAGGSLAASTSSFPIGSLRG